MIAAQTGSFDEVQEGENGFFFEIGNYEDLMKKIRAIDTKKHKFTPFLHMTQQEHLDTLEALYKY